VTETAEIVELVAAKLANVAAAPAGR